MADETFAGVGLFLSTSQLGRRAPLQLVCSLRGRVSLFFHLIE